MPVQFLQQREHLGEPRKAAVDGRVVLSRLPRGQSLIGRPALSMKIVLDGEERYEIGGRVHRLTAGSILVVEPGQDMQVTVQEREGAAGLCIYMPVDADGGMAQPGTDPLPLSPLLLPLVDHPFGRWLADTASRIMRQPQLGERAAGSMMLAARSGLASFLADTAARSALLATERPARRMELLRRIEIARAMLHAHPERTVPLAELASAAGLSPFHLARCFREIHGLPPAAYHRALRLDMAADMLARGHKPVELARSLGFASQASFTKAFVRRYGAPPGALRANARRSAHPTAAIW